MFSYPSNSAHSQPTRLHCPAAQQPTALAAARKRWQTWLLGLALTAPLVACYDQSASLNTKAAAQPIKVGVITLQTQAQTLSSTLPGRTSAFMSAEIRPQINGIVQKRLFTEGAMVKAGQAYEESQASAQQTSADVAAAQAALAGARINLKYTRISAPIAGRTGLSSVTPGALVTANQAGVLTTIAQLDPMYIDIPQSSTEMLALQRELAQGRFERINQADGAAVPITVQLEDGSPYPHTGRLQFTGVQVNPSTGALTLRAVVPNPDGVLLPGMFVQTLLPTGVSSAALLLPQQAVTRDIAGKASVLIANAEKKVERRPVELGRAVGNQWLASAGVAAGDMVIVDGFQRIKVGDTVNPQPVVLNAPPQSEAPAAATTTTTPATR